MIILSHFCVINGVKAKLCPNKNKFVSLQIEKKVKRLHSRCFSETKQMILTQ